MRSLPQPLLLALNGILLILLAACLYSAAQYFVQQLRYASADDVEDVNLPARLRRVYVESKASFAAAILFFGLFLRIGSIWGLEWCDLHRPRDHWLIPVLAGVLVFSEIPTIWGAVCWMRAVLPLRCGIWAWPLMVAGALVFGVGMALWPS